MNDRAPALEVHRLVKVYSSPEVRANDGISFAGRQGEAFGLLGPNGAGKSTLVKQIVGLIRPTSGRVALFGEEVVSGRSTRSSSLIAYLPQHSLGLDELKVSEALRYTAMLRGASRTAAGQQQEQLMERLALTELGDRPLRKLSGGQRRLVHIGMTLAGSLPILILDEPTTDIDPALRQEVWSLLDARRQEGAVIILVTHDVAEAEHVLDRVAILDRGRIVAHGTPAELKGELAQRVRLEVVVAEGSGLDIDDLARDFGGEVRVSGRQLSMWVPADEAVRRLEKVMSASDGFFEDLRLVTPSLEDVYLAAVGHAMEERP